MTGPAIAGTRAAEPMAAQVAQVRAFNRFYTNVIGVLHGMYLDSPYTLTEGRVLFEIARRPAVEVSWLRRELDIDAGYLSRVLTRFEADSLVTRHRSETDARRQDIRVTDAGRAAMAMLDSRAAEQIGVLLSGADCGRLLHAMRVITEELGRKAQSAAPSGAALCAFRPSSSVITRIACSSRPQSAPLSSTPICSAARLSSMAMAARPASVTRMSWRRASVSERCLVTRESASNLVSTRLRYPASMSSSRRSQDTSTAGRLAISKSTRPSVSVYGESRYMPCSTPMTFV